MSKIYVGTISRRELDKKIRRAMPPTEKVQGTPKGKPGFNRQRDSRAWQKESSHERG